MREYDGIGLAKAVLWEEAKGKLRALVAAEGTQQSNFRPSINEKFTFEVISEAVEAFIKDFEDNGHNE